MGDCKLTLLGYGLTKIYGERAKEISNSVLYMEGFHSHFHTQLYASCLPHFLSSPSLFINFFYYKYFFWILLGSYSFKSNLLVLILENFQKIPVVSGGLKQYTTNNYLLRVITYVLKNQFYSYLKPNLLPCIVKK